MRRPKPFLLGVIMLLGGLVAGQGAWATAQEATPVAVAEHPLVGTWQIDLFAGSSDDDVLGVFSPGGGLVGLVGDESMFVGAWEPTGDTTADLTMRIGDEAGITIVRMQIDVDSDDLTFTGTYTIEGVELNGTSSGEFGPGTPTGAKLPVQGPGTPVMSLEEAGLAPVVTPTPD